MANHLKNTNIVIYGFGRVAKCSLPKLIRNFHIPFIIDNNEKYFRDQHNYKNIPIYTFDQIKETISKTKHKIIITTSGYNYEIIKQELISLGLSENSDFVNIKDFMVSWYWSHKKECVISRIAIPITLKCTLNCIHCNTLIPYIKNKHAISFIEFKENIDLFFKCVDFVSTINIVGGEPLLHPQLTKFISYLYENYTDKFAIVQVISNGTIVPSNELIEIIEKYKIEFRLSDYGNETMKQSKLTEIIEKCNSTNMNIEVLKQDKWRDLGFPREKTKITINSEETTKHMIQCNAMCQSILNKKIYYCITQLGADVSGTFTSSEADVFNLNDETLSLSELKKSFMEYYKGNYPKGYIDFCSRCRGISSTNSYETTGGIQI